MSRLYSLHVENRSFAIISEPPTILHSRYGIISLTGEFFRVDKIHWFKVKIHRSVEYVGAMFQVRE